MLQTTCSSVTLYLNGKAQMLNQTEAKAREELQLCLYQCQSKQITVKFQYPALPRPKGCQM